MSKTYIEETDLFAKSCEEEVKVWDRKDRGSKGEAEEGEADEGGEQEAHTTKDKPFEVSATKGEVSQEKVFKSFTNEGMKGLKVSEEVDPANHSTYICDPDSDSLSEHAELARLVVDVENNFTQRKPNTSLAQQGKQLARSGQEKGCALAQLEEGDGGSMQMGCGSGCEEKIDTGEYECQATALVVQVLEEESNEENTLRQPAKPEPLVGLMLKPWEQDGLQDNRDMHRAQEANDEPKDTRPSRNVSLLLGDEEAYVGSICKTPPRRHKMKGLWELGESSTHPRRSVRISARTS